MHQQQNGRSFLNRSSFCRREAVPSRHRSPGSPPRHLTCPGTENLFVSKPQQFTLGYRAGRAHGGKAGAVCGIGTAVKRGRSRHRTHGHPSAKTRCFLQKRKEKGGEQREKKKGGGNKKDKYSTLFNLAFTARRALKITLLLDHQNQQVMTFLKSYYLNGGV